MVAEPDPALGQPSTDAVQLRREAPHVVSGPPVLFGQPRHDDPVAAQRDVAIRDGIEIGPQPIDADVGGDAPRAAASQQPRQLVGGDVRQPGQLDRPVAGRRDGRRACREVHAARSRTVHSWSAIWSIAWRDDRPGRALRRRRRGACRSRSLSDPDSARHRDRRHRQHRGRLRPRHPHAPGDPAGRRDRPRRRARGRVRRGARLPGPRVPRRAPRRRRDRHRRQPDRPPRALRGDEARPRGRPARLQREAARAPIQRRRGPRRARRGPDLRLGCSPATFLGEAQQTAAAIIRSRPARDGPGDLRGRQLGPDRDVASGAGAVLRRRPARGCRRLPADARDDDAGPGSLGAGRGVGLKPERRALDGTPFRIGSPDFIVATVELATGRSSGSRPASTSAVPPPAAARWSSTATTRPSRSGASRNSTRAWRSDRSAGPTSRSSLSGLRSAARRGPAGVAEMAAAIDAGRPHRASAELAAHIVDIIEAARVSMADDGRAVR